MSVWEGNMIRIALLLAAILAGPAVLAQQADEALIADATRDADGFQSHSVQSPRQRAASGVKRYKMNLLRSSSSAISLRRAVT